MIGDLTIPRSGNWPSHLILLGRKAPCPAPGGRRNLRWPRNPFRPSGSHKSLLAPLPYGRPRTRPRRQAPRPLEPPRPPLPVCRAPSWQPAGPPAALAGPLSRQRESNPFRLAPRLNLPRDCVHRLTQLVARRPAADTGTGRPMGRQDARTESGAGASQPLGASDRCPRLENEKVFPRSPPGSSHLQPEGKGRALRPNGHAVRRRLAYRLPSIERPCESRRSQPP